jgi:glucose dehydrogenase
VVATSPIGDGASAPRPSSAPIVVAFAVAAAVFAARSRSVGVPDLSESAPNASARYVDLDDIRPENVSRLAVAWTAHTGDFPGGRPDPTGPVEGFQTRPVLAGNLLIVTTTVSRIIALDAETGVERWRFDPFAGRTRRCELPNRGVTVWEHRASGGDVERTIFSGTCDGVLVALDPATGKLRQEFADGGLLDLKPGADARPGEQYAVTSPPAIFRDLVIVGAMVPEETSQGPSGDVRAFDVRTGRQVWRFHTVPQPGEFGHDTWPGDSWKRRTGVNVWTSMSVDEANGLVFLPVGSASYDFFGADRRGPSLYANSLVALDAATGQRRWHFQVVHHDVWDYDPPAQPVLADVRRGGDTVPVVVQLTKMGLVFVFNRLTGAPIFGVEERPVPSSDVPGEATSPTQPFPVKPQPLARIAPLTRAELTTVSDASRRQCEELFASVKSGGIFTPPGRDLTLWFPGTLGGATWSGGSFNPQLGYLFVNTNDVGAVGQMVARDQTYRRTSRWGAYARFWDDQQLPCQAPPWGKLHAIDLATGEIVWQIPFGDAPKLAVRGVTGTGTPSLGGSIATSTGLVFIGGTNDRRFRAFDARTGHLLWQAALPASGHATPISYRGPKSGRQFVVIAAGGGGRFSSEVSDAIVAFALPNPQSAIRNPQ